MNETSPKDLQPAIDHWRNLAAQERQAAADYGYRYGSTDTYEARAQAYERAARSLEIQRDTGVAVCSCCFKPLGEGCRVLVR